MTMHLKKISRLTLPLLLVLILIQYSFAKSARWEVVRPDGGKRSVLTVGGTERAYWLLEPDQSMTFKMDANSSYRIITRAKMPSTRSEVIYSFRIKRGDEDKLYSRAAERSKGSKIKNKKGRVGESREIYLESNGNNEEVTLRIGSKAKYKVYFRIQKEGAEFTSQVKYVAITPTGYQDAVSVFFNEAQSTYYRVDKERMLTVDVNGPTVLKVLARVMMDESMRGQLKIPITAFQDDKAKKTYSIQTKFSGVSTLPDYPSLVPSRGETFYVIVPAGRHRHTFELPEDDGQVILRFFLPEDDLGNVATP